MFHKDYFLPNNTADLRALKSWRDGQLNLAHGTETKRYDMEKTTTNKNRVGLAQIEATVWTIVREGSPGGRSETTGNRGRFWAGGERESGWAESVESEEEEVIGEGIVESEMEELVPDWGWGREKSSFQRQGLTSNT